MKALITAATLVPVTLLACLNVEPTSLSLGGHNHRISDIDDRLREIMAQKPGDVSVREKFGIRPNQRLTTEQEAVDKILRGETPSGLALLNYIEQKQPGGYTTAANIGTAYELMGDNANALKWIREGINRNADSHYGTEWLHALILQAKVDSSGKPTVRLTKRLLDVPSRMDDETTITVQGKRYSAVNLRHALYHQLTERVFFVKPKDPYVADLLYSYAIVEANLGTLNSALGLLGLARIYGFPDESLLAGLESKYRRTLAMIPIKRQITTGVLIAVAAVLTVFGVRRLMELCRA